MENEKGHLNPSDQNSEDFPISQTHKDSILDPLNSQDIPEHPAIIPISQTDDANGMPLVNQDTEPGIQGEVFEPLDPGQDQDAQGAGELSKILCADRPINGSSSVDAVSPVCSVDASDKVPNFTEDKKKALQRLRGKKLSDSRRMDRIPPGAGKKYRYPTGARLKQMTKLTIEAMSRLGYSKEEIAKSEKIGKHTVNAVLAKVREYPSDLVDLVKATMSGAYWVNARRAMEFIDDEKLSKSTAYQLAGVSAYLMDKALLLDGKATVRTEHITSSDPELARQIEELETQLNTFKQVKIIDTASNNTPYQGESVQNV